MSITVRLWSDEELAAIKAGTADKHLTTVFMNWGTFGEREINAFPYVLRHTYYVYFKDEDEPRKFYATDGESAWWFIEQEYKIEGIESISECTTIHRDIYKPRRIS